MVYFIRCIPRRTIKIGYTRDADSLAGRFRSLQTGNDDDIELIGTINSATLLDEKRLHWRFRSSWKKGEWYHPNRTLEEASQCSTIGEVLRLPPSEQEYEMAWSEDKIAERTGVCPACTKDIVLGQYIVRVTNVWVHLACADCPDEPLQIHRKCSGCGGVVFPGLEKIHKTCNDDWEPMPKKAKPKRKRRKTTARQEQEARELKTRREYKGRRPQGKKLRSRAEIAKRRYERELSEGKIAIRQLDT
jgi:hypothetical protein